MKPVYNTVLFDLDGTLVATHPGILRALEEAFRRLGHPVPSEEVLLRFIGPPVLHSLSAFCGIEGEAAAEALGLFRHIYNEECLLDCQVYPGMRELLCRLQDAGVSTAVATSKASGSAERLLRHLELTPLLRGVCASEDHIQDASKKPIVARALAVCGSDGTGAVMVGDTHFDLHGARDNGIDFVGILHGYSTREELEGQGADRLVEDTDALAGLLFA